MRQNIRLHIDITDRHLIHEAHAHQIERKIPHDLENLRYEWGFSDFDIAEYEVPVDNLVI